MKKATLIRNFLYGILMIVAGITHTGSQAQDGRAADTIDVARIRLSADLSNGALWYADSSRSITPDQLPSTIFKNRIGKPVLIKPQMVQQDVYLKFALRNTADTPVYVYFFPGFYFKKIVLYSLSEAGKVRQVQNVPDEHPGFKKIILAPHVTATLFAQVKSIRTGGNVLKPELVRNGDYKSFVDIQRALGRDRNTISFVIVGIMLMMIFYSLAVYTINRGIEFIYYAGYAFFMAAMLLVKEYSSRTPSGFVYFFESYLDFVMQLTGTFVYLVFLRSFIGSKMQFPFLHKVFLSQQVVIIISLLLFTYIYFYTGNFVALNGVENYTKGVLLAGTLLFIGYTMYHKVHRLYYLAIGHSFLLCSSLISLYLMNVAGGFSKSVPGILKQSLFYYEMGLTVELIFFMMALAAKNRRDIIERTRESEQLHLQYERQEFEKQLAVYTAKQEERNRISADMHDELGSGVTAIRLMSEIVKSKMKENTLPEIHRISSSANDLINKMNTIIWTMKSEHDTLESLITYIRTYALEFFENTSIECIVNIPAQVTNIEISGEKRRNIFLCVKESLHNALKHSKACLITISFAITGKLVIIINDNGAGIDFNKLRNFGNGLGNMKKRVEGINGSYLIENNFEAGTVTTIEVPL